MARYRVKITYYVSKWPKKTFKKFRIPETKHLSTDADISTNTTVGCTKNTPKTIFLKNGKKNHLKRKKSKCLEIC